MSRIEPTQQVKTPLLAVNEPKPIVDIVSKRLPKGKHSVYCVDATPLSLLDEASLSKDEKVVFSMLKFLFNRTDTPKITAKMLKNILIKRDEEFFKIACKLTQQILDSLWKQIQENPDPQFQKKVEVLIGNIIALLPFFNPETIESKMITIPQKTETGWERVTFSINRTPLAPTAPFWKQTVKFFGESIDIVELDPLNSTTARSIRSFQGTTFPAGKGMAQTLLADLFPFSSVGEMFLFFTRDALEKSLNKKGTTQKVDVYGQSLGGSTAQLVALAFPQKVEKAITYGPAKLYSWTVNRLLKKLKKKNIKFTPQVTSFVNEGDPVFKVGNALPPNAKTVRIYGKTKHNPLSAHAKAVCGQKEVVMVEQKNAAKWSVTAVIHLIIAPIKFALIAIVFTVWRLLVTLCYTLPKAILQSRCFAIFKAKGRQGKIKVFAPPTHQCFELKQIQTDVC